MRTLGKNLRLDGFARRRTDLAVVLRCFEAASCRAMSRGGRDQV